jgi:L-talarate/galactarate dehydratase
MKITRVSATALNVPLEIRLPGIARDASLECCFVEVETDTGIAGHGLGAITRETVIAGIVNDVIAPAIIGDDPLAHEMIWEKLYWALTPRGQTGFGAQALSAVDVALWDIKGKALDLPLWKLLGGGRDRIATYASGALRRGLKLEEAVTAAGRLREKGHRQTKMQLGLTGATSPAREVEQARLIREAVGPDMDLMCDINQRWRPEQAIDIGRRVQDAGVGLFWLEDVTTHDDYAGLARVADALATPVAGGEYLWGSTPFRHMLEARSVDIVMIDQVRSGGITPWLKIAGMAEAFNVPVVSHGVPEIHVHLIGAVPNGLTVEYMPRLFPLWRAVPQPRDGMLDMPTAPGLGLEFDEAAIEKYRA